MDEFIGECEICARGPRGLRVVAICGLDTFACHECLGDDSDMQAIESIKNSGLIPEVSTAADDDSHRIQKHKVNKLPTDSNMV